MDVQIVAIVLYDLFYHRPEDFIFSKDMAERYREQIPLDIRITIFEILNISLQDADQDYTYVLPFEDMYTNKDLRGHLMKLFPFMKEHKLDVF